MKTFFKIFSTTFKKTWLQLPFVILSIIIFCFETSITIAIIMGMQIGIYITLLIIVAAGQAMLNKAVNKLDQKLSNQQ